MFLICRTRSKALKREYEALDTLHVEYTDLLLTVDPKLAKAYKKSLTVYSKENKKKFVDGLSRRSEDVERDAREERGDGGERGEREGRGERGGKVDIRDDTSESERAKGRGMERDKSMSKVTSRRHDTVDSWAREEKQGREGDRERNSDVRGERDSDVRGRAETVRTKASEGESKEYWNKQGAWENGQKYLPSRDRSLLLQDTSGPVMGGPDILGPKVSGAPRGQNISGGEGGPIIYGSLRGLGASGRPIISKELLVDNTYFIEGEQDSFGGRDERGERNERDTSDKQNKQNKQNKLNSKGNKNDSYNLGRFDEPENQQDRDYRDSVDRRDRRDSQNNENERISVQFDHPKVTFDSVKDNLRSSTENFNKNNKNNKNMGNIENKGNTYENNEYEDSKYNENENEDEEDEEERRLFSQARAHPKVSSAKTGWSTLDSQGFRWHMLNALKSYFLRTQFFTSF